MLFFASPFFEAALSGHWAETGRPQSMSSVITISQPPTVPGTAHSTSNQVSEMTFAPLDSDCEDGDSDARPEASDSEMSDSEAKEKAREQSLNQLQSPPPSASRLSADTGDDRKFMTATQRRTRRKGPDAVVVLKEEKVWLDVAYTESHTYVFIRLILSMTF